MTNELYAFINIESLRQEQKEGLLGEVGASFKGKVGNTEELKGLASSLIGHKQDSEEWFFLLGYEYGESKKVRSTNEGYAHLRHGSKIGKYFIWEQYVQGEFNEFKKLDLRLLLGTGGRVRILTFSGATLYGGLGGFYEYERTENFDDKEKRFRINFYLSYLKKLDDHFILSFINYYQPSTKKFRDYRTVSNLGMRFKMTDKISLKIDFSLIYDSTPAPDIKTTDFNHVTGFAYTF